MDKPPKVGQIVLMRSKKFRPLKAVIRYVDLDIIVLHFAKNEFNDPETAEFAMNRTRTLYHKAFNSALIVIKDDR